MTLEVLVSTGRCFVGQAVVSLLETRTTTSSEGASDFFDVEQGQAGFVPVTSPLFDFLISPDAWVAVCLRHSSTR